MRTYTKDEIQDIKVHIFQFKSDMLQDDGEEEDMADTIARDWVEELDEVVLIELYRAVTEADMALASLENRLATDEQ